MYHDNLSKPSANRYFPFAAHEFVARVSALGFAVYPNDERLQVRLQNCDVECPLGFQLCSFFRMSYVALFSLPCEFPLALARKGVEAALPKFREIDAGPRLTLRDQQFVVYRAYLSSLGSLAVAQHIMNGGYRSYLKYRAASRLSRSQREPESQRVIFHSQIA